MKSIYINLDLPAISVQPVRKSDGSGNFLSVLLDSEIPQETRDILVGAGLLIEKVEDCPPEMLNKSGNPVHGFLGTEPLMPEEPLPEVL